MFSWTSHYEGHTLSILWRKLVSQREMIDLVRTIEIGVDYTFVEKLQ